MHFHTALFPESPMSRFCAETCQILFLFGSFFGQGLSLMSFLPFGGSPAFFASVIGIGLFSGLVRRWRQGTVGAVITVVPVHGVLLVAFPAPEQEPDTLAVFVKVINLLALGKPFPSFVHGPHGQQNVGVGIPVPLSPGSGHEKSREPFPP